jgi:hypothetical protein
VLFARDYSPTKFLLARSLSGSRSAVKDMLRKVILCLFLLLSAPAMSASLDPKELEKLLHQMNEAKIEFTSVDEDDPNGLK